MNLPCISWPTADLPVRHLCTTWVLPPASIWTRYSSRWLCRPNGNGESRRESPGLHQEDLWAEKKQFYIRKLSKCCQFKEWNNSFFVLTENTHWIELTNNCHDGFSECSLEKWCLSWDLATKLSRGVQVDMSQNYFRLSRLLLLKLTKKNIIVFQWRNPSLFCANQFFRDLL